MELDWFIQKHLDKERRHIHRWGNQTICRHIQYHVLAIEKAPRTIPEIDSAIEIKRKEIRLAGSLSERQRLNTEYDALEWLRGAVKHYKRGCLSEYYC